MKLTSLNADLDKIRPNQPPVQEDALHAMLSLCLDIQAHCCHDLDEGIVKDHRELNNQLAALSGLLCDIYDANSAEIKKRTQDAFPEELRTVRKETREAKQRMLGQESQQDELAQAKEELEKLLVQEKRNLADIQQQEAQVRKLRDALEQVLDTIRSIDLPALEQENSKLEAEKLQLEQKMNALREHITQLKQLLAKTRISHQASDTECARLAAELARCQEELAASEARRKELEQKLAEINNQIAGAEARCRDLTGMIQAAEAKLSLLTEEIRNAETQLTEKEAEIARLNEIYNNLLPRLNSSTEALRLLQEKITAAQHTIDENDAAIAEGQAKLAAQEAHICQQQNTIVDLNNAITKAQENLDTCRTQMAGLEQQKAALDNSLASARRENDRLTTLVTAAQAEEQLLNDLIASHQNTLARLANVQQEIQTAEETLKTAQQQLTNAEAQRGDLQQEITRIESLTQGFVQEIEKLTEDLDKAKAEWSEKLETRNAIHASNMDAIGEANRLERESVRLTADLEKTNSEIATLNANILQLNADIESAKAEYSGLFDQVYALQRELNHQNGLITDFREGELKAAQDALDAAKQLLTDLTTQRDTLKTQKAAALSNRTNIENDIKHLRLQIMQIEAPLKENTQERDTLQKTHDEKAAYLAQLMAQIGAISDTLAELQDKIKAAEEAIASDDNVTLEKTYKERLKEKEGKLADLDKMRAELPGLSDQLNKVRTEHEHIQAQQNYAKSEFRRLSEELKQLNAPETVAAVEQYKKNAERLAKVRNSLISAAESLKISTAVPIDTLVSWELTSVNTTLETLRSSIRDYTDALSANIR